MICGTVSVAYTITGPDDVGHDVSDDDARGARARGDRRLDELLSTNAQGLAAHDARHGQPADRADRDETAEYSLRPKITVRKMTKKISGRPLKISMMRIIS